jgi:lambda family phage portal protein
MRLLPSWLSRLLPRRAGTAVGGFRKFGAAQHNRLTHSWLVGDGSINSELRGDLDALRRRARDMAKNSPLARKFLGMCVSNIVGPYGFTLQARVVDGNRPDRLANDAIEAAWQDWCKPQHCDIGGRMSFASLTRAIVRGIARDGEALVRIRQDAGNPYGLALQFIDIERLDTTRCREPDSGRNAIIMGVEIDADGKPVAYWLSTAPHGRDATAKAVARVPAAEILHLYVTDDPEQVRGIPWMHAALLSVHNLNAYNETAIIAARIGAAKMGFFTVPEAPPKNAIADGEDARGVPFTSAKPGEFGILPPGYDFKNFNPEYPHAAYGTFVKEHKRDIATGLGVAYNALANDLEGVNFSSIRSGTLEERENWMLAQAWLVESFLDVVVFPALAGMNRRSRPRRLRRGSVPRARGDEPITPAGFTTTPPCSPRSRG